MSYWLQAISIVKKKGEPRYVGCIIHKDRVKKGVRGGRVSETEKTGEMGNRYERKSEENRTTETEQEKKWKGEKVKE